MGQSIQDGPSKICGRQPLTNLKRYGLLMFRKQNELRFVQKLRKND